MDMTTAQVIETSVTVNNYSPIQDYVHPDDQPQPTFDPLYNITFSILIPNSTNCMLLNSSFAEFEVVSKTKLYPLEVAIRSAKSSSSLHKPINFRVAQDTKDNYHILFPGALTVYGLSLPFFSRFL